MRGDNWDRGERVDGGGEESQLRFLKDNLEGILRIFRLL